MTARTARQRARPTGPRGQQRESKGALSRGLTEDASREAGNTTGRAKLSLWAGPASATKPARSHRHATPDPDRVLPICTRAGAVGATRREKRSRGRRDKTHADRYLLKYVMACSSISSGVIPNLSQSPGTSTSLMYRRSTSSGLSIGHHADCAAFARASATFLGTVGARDGGL